jgi:hypothetical protein
MANSQQKKRGGIASLFFTFEDPAQAGTESAESPDSTTPSSIPSASSAPATPKTTELDKGIYAQLIKVLNDNNMDGYDYFEFRGSLENMRAVVSAEGDRFRAAFAAVSSIVSIDRLISSAEFYLSKLAEKKTEFDGYVQQVVDAKVIAKEAEVENIKKMIAEKLQVINKTNEDINKLQEVSIVKQNDAVAERAKIETVRNNFNATFGKVIADIESDKAKIGSYLNQGK